MRKSRALGASLSSVAAFVWASRNFVFFQVKRYERIVGARKACGEQSDFQTNRY